MLSKLIILYLHHGGGIRYSDNWIVGLPRLESKRVDDSGFTITHLACGNRMVHHLLHISEIPSTCRVNCIRRSESTVIKERMVAGIALAENKVANNIATGQRVVPIIIHLDSLISFSRSSG